MKYFSNLHNGWADLKINQFHCKCSYIEDVPMAILNAWEDYLNTGNCIIFIDSEGVDHEIIITINGVKTITYDYNGVIFKNLSEFETRQDIHNLLKDLVVDIVDNVSEWAKWMQLDEEKENSKYLKELNNKIKVLGLN